MNSLKFSIRELLGLCLIVALGLGLWLTRIDLTKIRQDIDREKYFSGYIEEESENRIFVRQRDSLRRSEWNFRVLVPEGANYQFVWTYELPDDTDVMYSPYIVECREGNQFDMTVYFEIRPALFLAKGTDSITFSMHGNSPDSGITLNSGSVDFMAGATGDYQNVSNYKNNFAATSGVDDLDVYDIGDSIRLFRIEGKQDGSDKLYWLELNLQPAEKP